MRIKQLISLVDAGEYQVEASAVADAIIAFHDIGAAFDRASERS